MYEYVKNISHFISPQSFYVEVNDLFYYVSVITKVDCPKNDTFQCFSGVSCYRRRLMSPNASILAMTTSSTYKNPLPMMEKVMNFEINFAPITQALYPMCN